MKIQLCVVTPKNEDRAEAFEKSKMAIIEHFGSFRFDNIDGKWIFRVSGKRHNMAMRDARHYSQLCNEIISAKIGYAFVPAIIVK